MKKQHKQIILASVGLLLAAAAIIAPWVWTSRDLRMALGDALNIGKESREFFFLNLPPAVGRYPGSTFLTNQWEPVELVAPNDAKLKRTQKFTLVANATRMASGSEQLLSKSLGQMASNSGAAEFEIQVHEGQVVEMKYADLEEHLQETLKLLRASGSNVVPMVIVRSYEGKISVRLKRKQDASATAWAELKEHAAKQAKQESDKEPAKAPSVRFETGFMGEDAILLDVPEPVVFAFEVSKVRLAKQQHLGAPGDKIELEPLTVQELALQPQGSLPLQPGGFKWALATIASGHYQDTALNQEWTLNSAEFVAHSLEPFQPAVRKSLVSSPQSPLSASAVLDFVRQAGVHARQEGAQLLIVYYVGHMVSHPGQDLALVMGDAKADILRPVRGPSTEGRAEQFGDQVGGMMQLANVLQAEFGPLPPGLLSLRQVHESLAAAGLPGALLVDGCMKNEEFEAFRRELGFELLPGERDFAYVGDAEFITTEMGDFANRLRDFANDRPYLRGDIPVILGAKPGTYAFAQPHPDWVWAPPVGPLAVRLARWSHLARTESSPISLAVVLRQAADFRGLGEISPSGSISWSDFSKLESITGDVHPVPLAQ